MSPAHRGATALVPPMTVSMPSARTSYPVAGSASPATSGTPRPPPAAGAGGTSAADCQIGLAKMRLTPPPVAPPVGPSFHTTSLDSDDPDAVTLVPPHARANGLAAGKTTTSRP